MLPITIANNCYSDHLLDQYFGKENKRRISTSRTHNIPNAEMRCYLKPRSSFGKGVIGNMYLSKVLANPNSEKIKVECTYNNTFELPANTNIELEDDECKVGVIEYKGKCYLGCYKQYHWSSGTNVCDEYLWYYIWEDNNWHLLGTNPINIRGI